MAATTDHAAKAAEEAQFKIEAMAETSNWFVRAQSAASLFETFQSTIRSTKRRTCAIIPFRQPPR
jgi:hypothetical protein